MQDLTATSGSLLGGVQCLVMLRFLPTLIRSVSVRALLGETGMAASRIDAIDGLRGIAALCVAVLHFQPWYIGTSVATWGNIPTQLFFILSGYILTAKYEDGLRSGAVTARTFIVHRISRMWPLHIFALLLLIASELIFWNYYKIFHVLNAFDTTSAFWLNVFMIQDWGFYREPNFNKPSWSISSEFAVNLAWMAALIFLRWNLKIALLAAAASTLLMLSVENTLNFNAFHTVFGITHGILRTALGFSIGCVIYWYVQRKGAAISTVLSGAIQTGLVATLVFYSMLAPFGADWLLSLILLPAITLVALGNTTTAWIMATAPFRWLGRISYSVYLLHLPIANLMSLLIAWGIGLPPAPYLGLLWITIVLALSTLTFYAIELPGMTLMRRLSRRSQSLVSRPTRGYYAKE